MAPRSPSGLALLASAVAAAYAVSPAPAPARGPDTVVAPSAGVSARIESLSCDVWGGDGDNLPTLWTLRVGVVLSSHDDDPLRVERIVWKLDPVLLDGVSRRTAELAPHAQLSVVVEKRLDLEALGALRDAGEVGVAVEVHLRRSDGSRRVERAVGTLAPAHCRAPSVAPRLFGASQQVPLQARAARHCSSGAAGSWSARLLWYLAGCACY